MSTSAGGRRRGRGGGRAGEDPQDPEDDAAGAPLPLPLPLRRRAPIPHVSPVFPRPFDTPRPALTAITDQPIRNAPHPLRHHRPARSRQPHRPLPAPPPAPHALAHLVPGAANVGRIFVLVFVNIILIHWMSAIWYFIARREGKWLDRLCAEDGRNCYKPDGEVDWVQHYMFS